MGSGSGNRNGDGEKRVAAESGAPALLTAENMVRSVKEIVNCTEQEIHAALEECDMDVNRAVEMLLSQDSFQEVKSKRERRKEGAFISRTTGNNEGLSRGGKTGSGSDFRAVQSGFTHETYNDVFKANGKGEGGSVYPSSMAPTTHVVRKNDYFSVDSGRQSSITRHFIADSALASSGPQPSMSGMSKGCLSMADIVRMGKTSSQVTVSHDNCNTSGDSACGNLESSIRHSSQNHSEQQDFLQWPVIEQPISRNLQELNMSASSNDNGPIEHPSLHVNAICLQRNCETDAAPWGDVACDNVVSEKNESASISSKPTVLSSNTGVRSDSNANLRSCISSDLCCSYEHQEDVSSVASILKELSIEEAKQKVPTFEDDPSVVIPFHLQALGADCPHLTFGTYNGRSSSASSVLLTSNHLSKSDMEEKSSALNDSSAISSQDLRDKLLGFDVLSGGVGDKSSDFLPSPKQWCVKHIVPEETVELEHNISTPVSDPRFLKSHWVNTTLPLKQPDMQSGNHFTFPRELCADSNSIPGDVLALLMSQSQPARHSNAVSSISNPAISMSKVMEPGAFPLPMRSALPQDPTLHSSTHFHQLLDTNRYLSLPQNRPYCINTEQTISGNTAYNQSLADMKYNLLQNRNEFLTNRLPPATAGDAFSYGNLDSSLNSYGSFLSNPSIGHMVPSSNFNEILPSQYIGGRNISSIQQPGRFSHWDYGAESRSSIIPERTQSQCVSPGYSDLYHSQRGVPDELQLPGGFQDLSSEQLHKFLQHRR